MYSLELSQRSQKFIDKLDFHLKDRLETNLKRLKDNPVPSDSKFIGRGDKGEKIFRYRIGDYRALYCIYEESNIILVIKIDKRPRVYD
mgnify:CR=1 FL=1